MSTKAPIYLKRRSRKGKKEKLRDLLSSDMISPPLGDFRHTIHIGSGGGADDLFGDLSFLQGKFHLLPGLQRHALSQHGGGLGRTASVGGRPPSAESSPLLKNALSLPVIGGVQALTLPASAPVAPTPAQSPPAQQAPPPKPPRLHLEDRGPASPAPRLGRRGSEDEGCAREEEDAGGPQERPYLSQAGSLLSLHLDLGPSILDEVLQIMDGQRLGGLSGGCLPPGGRQEIYT